MRFPAHTVCLVFTMQFLLVSCLPKSQSSVGPTGSGGGGNTLEAKYEIRPSDVSLMNGEQLEFKVVKVDPSGQVTDLSSRARWDSSDLDVAFPVLLGTVQLLKTGSATITASVNGKTVSTSVKSLPGWAPIAVTVGGNHTCVLLENYSVRCWGLNNSGQLGAGDTVTVGLTRDTMGGKIPKIDLGSGRTAKAIGAGMEYSCALLDDNTVKCWGNAGYGITVSGSNRAVGDEKNEMGDNLLAINFGTGRKVKSLSTGDYHACVILDNNTVKCWGNNTTGQLGLGDKFPRGMRAEDMGDSLPAVDLGTGRTAKSILASRNHSCAILDNDAVKCWGGGLNASQLGFSASANPKDLARGDDPGEMGDNLPAVNFGSGKFAKTLVSRADNTCAILNDDSMKCWPFTTPDANGDRFVKYNLGTGRIAKQLSFGDTSMCALLDNDQVKCWGGNSVFDNAGSLGLGDVFDRYNATLLGDALPYVDLGTGRKVKSLSSGGSHHSCAILDNKKMKCWGSNRFGQLGIGDTATRGDGPNEMGDLLPDVLLP